MGKLSVILVSIFLTLLNGMAQAQSLVEVIAKVKPSVVGIAIYSPTGAPQIRLLGTGFVVGEGRRVVTNAHVIEQVLDSERFEEYVVLEGGGRDFRRIQTELEASHPEHDLAVLKLKQAQLRPLDLAGDDWQPDGTAVAFTGFPIGAVLGLYPATHRGIISTRTPVAIPANHSGELSIERLKRLRNPFVTYQLDAVAYPGNSGSPLYRQEDGKVIGIINKVFVQESRENALKDPSGISYAVPVKYLNRILSGL